MSLLPRNLLRFLIYCMILGMLFIGLYPFNYFPPNKVSPVENGSGLHFYGRGIALSTWDDNWPSDGNKRALLTLELLLKPERTYYRGIPHILSLCDETGREVLYLGQWKNSLIVRLMKDSRWIEKVKREIGAGDVLNPGEPVLITLVFSEGNADIYVNSQLVREFGEFDLAEAISKHPIRSLVFGNSSTGDRSWRGEILSFSAFYVALDSATIQDRYEQGGSGRSSAAAWEFIKYRLEEPEGGIVRNEAGKGWDLRVPETLTPLRSKFLSLPSRKFLQKRSFYRDAFINVAGFVPLGLALNIFFTGTPGKKYSMKTFLFPVLLGGLLSLFIETNQAFLGTRSSSMTDLVLNILGSGLGVSIYWWGINTTAQRPKPNVQRN